MKNMPSIKMQRTANAFRLGMEGKAGQLFSELIDELLTVISTSAPDESLKNFNTLLQKMIEAQLKADFLYLADLIEYELIDALREIDDRH